MAGVFKVGVEVAGNGEGSDICTKDVTEDIEIVANLVGVAGIPTPVGVQLVRIAIQEKRKMTLYKKVLFNMRLFLR